MLSVYIFVAAPDPFLFRANTSKHPPPPNKTSVTTPRYAHNQLQHKFHAHARTIYKSTRTYCNFTLSQHFATTATIQMPASDQINNKPTQARRPSNIDQVNLTSLLQCNAITPCYSYVTVAPSQPHSLIIACMESLNLCFQLSLPLTRSSTVTPITGRGRRRRRGRGRQRRLHHTQKEMSYYEGNHFLLISQHNAHHLFYFISPDSFHGSSFYTISRCTSIIVLDTVSYTHLTLPTIYSV